MRHAGFLSVPAVAVLPGVSAAAEETPESVAEQFLSSLGSRDFAAVRRLVTAESLPVVDRLEKQKPDESRKAAKSGEPVTERNCSYVYFGGMNLAVPYSARAPLGFDKPGIRHDGVINVLYADGFVMPLKGEFATVAEIVKALIDRGSLPEEESKVLLEKAARADRFLKEEVKNDEK